MISLGLFKADHGELDTRVDVPEKAIFLITRFLWVPTLGFVLEVDTEVYFFGVYC